MFEEHGGSEPVEGEAKSASPGCAGLVVVGTFFWLAVAIGGKLRRGWAGGKQKRCANRR